MDQGESTNGGFETTTTLVDTESITSKDVLGTSAAEPVASEEAAPEVEAAAKVEEAPAEEKKEEQSEEEKRFASRFAALSRREKSIREQESQLNARMAEIDAKMEALQKVQNPEPEPEMPWEEMLLNKPLEALEKKGLSYEELTKIALNDGKLTPEMELKIWQQKMDRKYTEELEAVKSKLAEKEEQEAEQLTKKEEERLNQVIVDFKNQISEEVSSKPEEYELLGMQGEDGIQTVYDVIDLHYKQTSEEGEGAIMSVDEASKLVEEHLLEEAKQYLNKSKIKKLLETSEKTPETKPEVKRETESVTLSNSQSQVSQAGERYLSDEESKARAAKMIRWNE
jgi:hypothetical protein